MSIEFNNRDPDFHSVAELCRNIQASPEACPYLEDLTKLLDCSETFKTRWTETRAKSRMYRSFMENRLAIYYEWLNDVNLMSAWVEGQKDNISGIASQYLDMSGDVSFYVIKDFRA